jgi:hypothetical protein
MNDLNTIEFFGNVYVIFVKTGEETRRFIAKEDKIVVN